MSFRVAIAGDSAMWGQGLLREHTYAYLAATRLARIFGEKLEVLAGRGEETLRGEARSGAKIRALPDIEFPAPQPGEPDAEAFRPGDYSAFKDTYPFLFHDDVERLHFRPADDESPAARLYGEVPATFPTVEDGIRHLASNDSESVDLVVLNGGMNDAAFEDAIHPDGPTIATLDATVATIFHDRLRELLAQVRSTFPHAMIVVVGYYSPLSHSSDHHELVRLAKFMSGHSKSELVINTVLLNHPFLGPFWKLGPGEDIDALVGESVRRSLHGAARVHFWTRRTIVELPNEIRGPGVVYADPAFFPEHAAFAPDSRVHEGYHMPDDGRHAVHDEMLHKRLAEIPTPDIDKQYAKVQAAAVAVLTQHTDVRPVIDALGKILLDGHLPTSLRWKIQSFVDHPDLDELHKVMDAIQGSVERVFFATIASFLHPSEKGAARTAERIVLACHGSFSARSVLREMPINDDGPRTSLRSMMQRLGLQPGRGLRKLANIATIRSVGIQFDHLRPTLDPASATVALGDGLVFALDPPARGTQDFLCAFEAPEVSIAKVTGIVVSGLAVFDAITVYLNGAVFFAAPYPSGRHDPAGNVRFPL